VNATGAVELVVRPDAVRIEPGGPIGATVTRTTFAGTRVELTVAPDAGPELEVAVDPEHAPPVAARVTVVIDPDALLVYPNRAD
jgi:thiamine transport system ATP-binding protein